MESKGSLKESARGVSTVPHATVQRDLRSTRFSFFAAQKQFTAQKVFEDILNTVGPWGLVGPAHAGHTRDS